MEDKQKKIETSDIPDSFEFRLQMPVHYAFGGNLAPCHSVKIQAPGVDLVIEAFALKRMVAKATIKSTAMFNFIEKISRDTDAVKLLPDKGKKEKENEVSPSELARTVEYIALMSEMDLKDAIEEFRNLAFSGCVMVNDHAINSIEWDEMRADDKLEIFWQFVGVFIMPSAFPSEIQKEEKPV
jgi:hypothetical protein